MGSQISGLYAEARDGHEGLRKELPSDENLASLPAVEAATLREMDALQGGQRADLDDSLRSIAEVSAQVSELLLKLKAQKAEVAEKQEALRAHADGLASREQECTSREDDLRQRSREIAQQTAKLVEWERAIIGREENAALGFVAQNEEALSELKMELESLRAKCREERKRIADAEAEANERFEAREKELSETEAALNEKQMQLDNRARRLQQEHRGIEAGRELVRDEIEGEYLREIENYKARFEREQASNSKLYEQIRSLENELDGYRYMKNALGGVKPEDMMEDLRTSRARVAELEEKLSQSDDAGLRSTVDTLRRVLDVEKQKADDLGRELGAAKQELSRLRVGVVEKETLAREKRVLESHKILLENNLRDLEARVEALTTSQEAESPFPQLFWMDSATKEKWVAERAAKELDLGLEQVTDLDEFSVELQQRTAQAEAGRELYFDLADIRLLLAGLAMSQLHIFQGISGTGKTSLAKAFAKAIGGSCTDIAVQAGWRDRDDLLGHFNSFEKRFYERDCLQGLYRAQTAFYEDRCNIILLDEMNLSRPEQYFAEFLSALEKNEPGDRLISLSEGVLPRAPKLLVEGRKIRVPANVWFIGTANHDESTNEFADKTYDRAHVMTLPKNEGSFDVQPLEMVAYSFRSLMQRFDEAISRYESEAGELLDELVTGGVGRVLQETFELGWGNRFERQARRFIPVFMASGGKAGDAMDHLLASRVLRRGKVVGRHDVSSDDVGRLGGAIEEAWKRMEGEPRRSLDLLEEDRRRKERGL
ncbi:MAG: AAA family ATPase [Lautropia sp.]|nr:AAA family ATPase [Lautropia sp.]